MAKKLASPKPPDTSARIVLLPGPNAFLAVEHTNALREKLVKAHSEIDVLTFDAISASPADVLDECRSLGLMQQHKLIVVDNAEQLVKGENRTLIERYAKEPCEEATLVLRSSRWFSGKLDEMILAVGNITLCEEADEAHAATWAVRRAEKRYQARLDPKAASALIDRVGADLGRLDAELARLSVSGDHPGVIDEALVRQSVGRSREEEIWAIQETLLSARPGDAVRHARDMIEISNHPPTLLTWSMSDLARKLHVLVHATRQGANPDALSGPLRLWGDAKFKMLGLARRTTPQTASELLEACITSDARQKTGLSEGSRAIEGLALRVTTLLASSDRPGSSARP